jgi:Flp pilus assembly protein TadG
MSNVVWPLVISVFTTGSPAFEPKRYVFLNSLPLCLFNLWKDQGGQVAVITGLCATALMGFAALAIDVGSWQVAQRSMQGAADAAAYSAGIAYTLNNGTTTVTQAKGITAQMGYVDGQGGTTVAVNQPPTSGNYTSKPKAIEVIIQQPQPRFFAGLFLSSNPTVQARAVALGGTGNGCVLALDTANVTDDSVSGGGHAEPQQLQPLH